MSKQRSVTLVLFVLIVVVLTACQPIQPIMPAENGGTAPAEDTRAALIVLPDGTTCAWAGEGATLAFDGKRLNYTCNESAETIIGLLGDLTPVEIARWSVAKATISHGADGFTLQESETITFLAATLELADDTQCAFAGEGATMAFADKRLNYTCGEEGDLTVALLGDLTAGEAGVLLAEKVLIDGSGSAPTVQETTQVAVTQINAAPSTGEGEATAMGENELVGPTWQWQRSELADGTVSTPTDPTRYTLTFLADNQVQVQLDCNRGGGGYTLADDQLALGAIATTLMACPPDSLDSTFGEQLGQVVAYLMDGDNLVLQLDSDSGSMIFAAATSEEAVTTDNAVTGTAILSGTVVYLQRMALLPGAVIDVQMQDGTGAVIATWNITTTGENVPLPFALAYDPAQIDEAGTYTLLATITLDGQVRWRSAEPVAVLTNGAPTSAVEILVRPARAK